MTIDTAALREMLEDARGDFEALHRYLDAARTALPELLDRVEKLEKVAEAGHRAILDRTQFCDGDFDELDKALRDAGYGG